MRASPLVIVGLLKHLERLQPASVGEMNKAVLKEAAARHRRSRRKRRTTE